MRSSTLWTVIIVGIFVFAFVRGAFVREDVAVKALEMHGFDIIEVTDHAWFLVGLRGCSGNDAAKFTAKAVNPAGDTVEVCVCSGWLLKGATLRSR